MQYCYLLLIFGSNLHFVWSLGYQTRRQLHERLFRNYIPDPSTETKYIDQPIDHFGNNNETWKMKFFQNLNFFKPGGPIYVFIDGEAPADLPYFKPKTVFYDLALSTSGAMFHTEHRYYGTSKPYDTINAEKLQYLSSKQALADVAYLIENIKRNSSFLNSKVVVFGGSYAGNLAAWMRKLYPNLVDAAVASSAPVLAKKDFYEYLEKVNDDIKQYGTEQCLKKVSNRFEWYQELLATPQGQKTLKKDMSICPETDLGDLDNQYNLINLQTGDFKAEAQYGDPNTISSVCSFERDPEIKAVHIENNLSANCISIDFKDQIHTKFANDSANFAWAYQVCTEFGYLQTHSSDKQPFGKYVPLDFFVKICPMLFGSEFDEARMDKGIEETNKLYGGLSPNVTRVIFVNSGMDPWSTLSILEDISDDVPARVIPDRSHCSDMFEEVKTDSAEIKATREFIKTTLKKWIISN